jgi:hypothetical protein
MLSVTDVQKSMMLKYIVKQFLSIPLILGNIKDTAFSMWKYTEKRLINR